MANEIALTGYWSSPSSWQAGAIPPYGSSVVIASGASSYVDLGSYSLHRPFVVDSLSFDPGSTLPSKLVIDVNINNAAPHDSPFLQVQDLYGGPSGNHNEVLVGSHIQFYATPNGPRFYNAGLYVSGNAINTHFVITGGTHYHDHGTGEVDIGHQINGSSFTFDGGGFEDTLILEHPPFAFIANEVDFAAVPPRPGYAADLGSGPEKIELGGLHFDGADFMPRSLLIGHGTTETGELLLTNHQFPVFRFSDVQVTGYAGSIGGHFSVGTDQQTHFDYVQYSR